MLVMLLKRIFKMTGIPSSDQQGFGSYAIQHMCIHAMQSLPKEKHPMICLTSKLERKDNKYWGNTNCGFLNYDRITHLRTDDAEFNNRIEGLNAIPVSYWFRWFMEYYIKFNYKDNAISIRDGRLHK